jgi:hypothetical protein
MLVQSTTHTFVMRLVGGGGEVSGVHQEILSLLDNLGKITQESVMKFHLV